MRAIEVITDDWPLVKFRIDGKQTDADVDHYLTEFEALFHRDEPFLALTEVGEFDANFGHIKRIAQWTKSTSELAAKCCRGGALVVKSDSFRFILSSFLLVTPMPNPFVCLKSREEALKWLHEKAVEEGIELGPIR